MENQELIKNALSYDMGSDLHESWRQSRKSESGVYEPRIKESKDLQWNAKHGTNQVDIANTSFGELPSNWQYENYEAAKVAINLVFDKLIANELITNDMFETLSSIIHEEWLKRNEWVFDPNYGNPKLAVPYLQLSEEEKEKDRVQLKVAIEKVNMFICGKINIDEICEKYGIEKTMQL